MTIKLLDLYCKAGGCSMGYKRAADELGIGIEITGVDIKPQPNYPFRFIQSDAVEFLNGNLQLFTHVHASPPCQAYSRTKSLHSARYPSLLPSTRAALQVSGLPYIIENVPGAPMENPVFLDGTMFDLRVVRKRLFESNMPLPQHAKGVKKGTVGGKNFNRYSAGYYFIIGGHQAGTLGEWRMAMDINWMNKEELREAIPPPYTHYLGLTFFKNMECL